MSIDIWKQVVSLDLAKRLFKIGIKQESLFYYVRSRGSDKQFALIYRDFTGPYFFEECDSYYSAFTAGELAVLVKGFFDLNKKGVNKNIWHCYFQPENGTDNSYCFEDTQLAEILGKILVAQSLEGELNV